MLMKKVALTIIGIYQKTASPLTYLVFGKVCRFIPTCSQYAYQSIERYGTIKGSILGIRRIFRCHPFAKGGFDPVR